MHLLAETKKICSQYRIRPARSKGQHFLIRENIYERIVRAAGLTKDDVVLEVGPGLGFLTERLASAAKRVIAVELDDKLAQVLRERLAEQGVGNVEVVNEDILKIPDTKYQILNTSYKIVANLPYNITSRFLRKFLSEVENKPTAMVLMVQKEVAQRLVAKPGQMSLLAVSAQFYADIKILFNVSKDAFWPAPRVDSAVVELTTHLPPNPSPYKGEGNRAGVVAPSPYQGEGWGEVNETQFFALVKAGFASKRKQLQGNLVKNFKIKPGEIKEVLAAVGLNELVRAQELSLADWVKLYVVLHERNVL